MDSDQTRRAAINDSFAAMADAPDWPDWLAGVRSGRGANERLRRRALDRLDLVDYLITATAAEHQADLLTLNVKHFPMFAQLEPPWRN